MDLKTVILLLIGSLLALILGLLFNNSGQAEIGGLFVMVGCFSLLISCLIGLDFATRRK